MENFSRFLLYFPILPIFLQQAFYFSYIYPLGKGEPLFWFKIPVFEGLI